MNAPTNKRKNARRRRLGKRQSARRRRSAIVCVPVASNSLEKTIVRLPNVSLTPPVGVSTSTTSVVTRKT